MAAFVSTGWDENLISQTAGSYIIQFNPSQLPLPLERLSKNSIYFIRLNLLIVIFLAMKLLLILLPIYPQQIFGILNWEYHGNLIRLIT